jgi:hypothetical protein
VRNQLAWTLACLAFATTGHGQPIDPQQAPAPSANDLKEGDDPRSSVSQAALEAALARYAQEPSAEQVVQEALRVAPSPRAEAMAARARTAGWVPKIGFRARRGQTVDLSAPQTLDAAGLRVRSNDDLTLEATLSFDLDRVIFRHEEVTLLRQSNNERQARERVVREVIALYFERRHLQLTRDLKGDPNFECNVRIAEIEALLNAFTNGAFRRMIAKNRWTTGANTPASISASPPKSSSTAKP